jgi:hypothetical protein
MKAIVEKWNTPEAIAKTPGRQQGSLGKASHVGLELQKHKHVGTRIQIPLCPPSSFEYHQGLLSQTKKQNKPKGFSQDLVTYWVL